MVIVSYHCPRCGAIAELERDPYLADKCVTADPLEGWQYGNAFGEFEDADGVVIVCGAAETEGEGCGEPYHLNFVKFDDGEEVDPRVPAGGVRFDFRV